MPAYRNPLNMEADDILAEIAGLREGVDHASRRILELSKTLHDRMRRQERDRNPQDRNVYLTYSNAWTRFAGMVLQGLQRTRQTDRLLRLLPEPVELDDDTPNGTRPVPEDDRAHSMPATSPLEDFIKVYGEELMQDAPDRERQR